MFPSLGFRSEEEARDVYRAAGRCEAWLAGMFN